MVAFFVYFLCPYRLSQFYKCKGKKWVTGIVGICEPWNTELLRWNCFSNFIFRKVQDIIVICIYLQNMSYIKHYLYIVIWSLPACLIKFFFPAGVNLNGKSLKIHTFNFFQIHEYFIFSLPVFNDYHSSRHGFAGCRNKYMLYY